MNFTEFYKINRSKILDISLSKEKRMRAFSYLVDYIEGINNASEYLVASVNAVLNIFDFGWNEVLLKDYLEQVDFCFGYKNTNRYTIIISEDSYVAWALKDLYSDTIQFIDWNHVNQKYLQEFDAFFLCSEENDEFRKSLVEIEKQVHIVDFTGILRHTLFNNCYMRWCYEVFLRDISGCDCLITGLSYIRDALQANYFNRKVCNIANASQDIYYDFLMFKEAIKLNPNLKTVIIGLAPYSLRYDLSLSCNKDELEKLYFFSTILKSYHNNKSISNELDHFIKEIDLMTELLGDDCLSRLWKYLMTGRKREIPNIKFEIFSPEGITSENEIMYRKYHKPYKDTLEENSVILKEYLIYAHERGVNTVFFIPPFSKWYKERWDADYRDELRKYIKELSIQYPTSIVDYSDMELDDFFYGDFGHLNQLGAIVVSRLMNEELEREGNK